MLTLFLLSFLSLTSPALAHTQCYFHLVDDLGFAHPSAASDCRKLMAHIPVSPPLLNSNRPLDHNDTNGYLKPFGPYLPKASFLLNTCSVAMIYHAGPMPPGSAGLKNMLENVPEYAFSTSLLESSVFKVWAAMRGAVGRVADQCLDMQQREGVDWGPLDIPEIADAWYMVDVRVVVESGVWDNSVVEEGPEAVDWGDADGDGWRYAWTLYKV